ncbi:SDR family oxidoreductase [Massilia sp. YIM B02763]|uniref:SDR family oxidoreductase n=1 Tax=Massilia sp. YIM B02763 TaxID=3050130 RepID=UPI0025B6EBBE|nr:SDR family oxidoreductase [Massilia sp. YIM B02763]MDN4055076.1 SDR family oxidoreductase [Massilia sp. YIM B02763]
MNHPLDNKVAFVTGAARGIGAAIVRRLAADGAAVAFTYQSSSAAADALAAEIAFAGGRALALQADATDAKAIATAVDAAAARFGRIDVVVNNAGIFLPGTLDDFSLADFDRTVAVNLRAVFATAKAALPHIPDGGRIVNVGSTNALRVPFGGAAFYAMSKSALTGLAKGLARDLGPRDITVNNVLPGPVDTDMNPEGTDFGRSLHAFMALPRHGRPQEIAALVAWLAGPESSFVTGADLLADGGFAA